MKLVDLLVLHDSSTDVCVRIVDENGKFLTDFLKGSEIWPLLNHVVHGWTVTLKSEFCVYVYREGVLS